MTARQPQPIFLLGNGRSGTRFLSGLFRHNAADCTAVHEPYLTASRPSMFGLPIYDLAHGNHGRLRQAFARKARGIRSYRTAWYVETSHAFLLSFADLAIEAFPDLKLVHVIRNPLQVCASQAARERFIRRWRLPLCDYRGDNGRNYFRWRLTGDEPIYRPFTGQELSLFQFYCIQWIELENRAQQFLNSHAKRAECFVLQTPRDLNDTQRIAAMFDFFGLRTKRPEIAVRGPRNRTPGRRAAEDSAASSERLQEQLRGVVDRLPSEYLACFGSAPYVDLPWRSLLDKSKDPELQLSALQHRPPTG
jgi:hypothetical protein